MIKDLITILLALIVIAAAIVAIVGYYICGINLIEAIFDMGGNYVITRNWFITSVSCSIGAKVLYQFIRKRD